MNTAVRDAIAHMLLAQREQIDAALRLLYAADEPPAEVEPAPRKTVSYLGMDDHPHPDEG